MSITKATLRYKGETEEKIYQVEIVYLNWQSFQVNFAYGRRGNKFKSGTKTDKPVTLLEAEKIFDDLIKSKKNKGYQIIDYHNLDLKQLLEISLDDRQAIVDEIKRANTENFVEEAKKAGLEPRAYWVGLDLSNVDLSNTDLKECNFYKTNLIGTNLTNVNFQGVFIEESRIDETTQIDPKWRLIWELVNLGGENRDLQGVDLSEIEISNLSQVNLNSVNLEGANFSQSYLSNFDFTNANLKNANLYGCTCPYLEGAYLDGADLRDTYHDEVYLNNSSCIATNFSRATFEGEFMNLENADCRTANFQGAVLTAGIISGANFCDANFEGVIDLDVFFGGMWEHTISEPVKFQNTNFSKTNLSNFSFSEILGDNTELIDLVDWNGAIFNEANLENTDFSDMDFSNASFVRANLKGANLENCNLFNVDLTEANLEDANLQGIDFSQICSCENIKINSNTQIDAAWEKILQSHQ